MIPASFRYAAPRSISDAARRAYARRPHGLSDPSLDTRLRFARRALEAAIILLGIATMVICVALAIWRVRRRNDFGGPRLALFAAISMAAAAVVTITGYLGAHLGG